ncbi:MAG: lysophospholipid acyltransferase family protein, partial [Betaproteobacteria bacterium]
MKNFKIAGAFLRAIIRIILLLAWFLVSLIQQSLGFILRTGDGRHLRLRFYRGALRILGVRIRVFNDFSPRRPVFVVANHVSYLDVFVLGSLIPAVFVSKQEVRDWPVVGWVAWLQRTIFITRRPARAVDELAPLGEALENGFNVIMFPEGTSTNGTSVLPFKSALFEAPKRA